MNEDDLMLDYLFSDMAKIGNAVKASTISGDDFFIKGIQNTEGSSLQEKTKNYLHNCTGVSVETLNQIIYLLTENVWEL